jgi:nucleotide-binding universal stress UspA family protein
MLDSILVPLDGSSLAERAVPYATALAGAARAKLVLMRALPIRPPGSAIDEQEGIRSELEHYADGLRATGLTVDVIVHRVYVVDVARAICAAAEERHAGLIVMSTHGRSGLDRWIYGSVADTVLRQSEIPVLLVPPPAEQPLPTDRPLRVLVPLDGSELAEEALGIAEQLAETVGAELVLLRVVEPPGYALYGDGFAYLPYDEEAELNDARAYLQAHVDRLRADGKPAAMRVVLGPPATVVTQAAQETGADLVAMATHGRGGLARLVLGSIAASTLQRATVPVLLVRPAALSQTDEEAEISAEAVTIG